MPTTQKNTVQNKKNLQQTQEQPQSSPIESAEVMYYVDSR